MKTRRDFFLELIKTIFEKGNVRFIDDKTKIATNGNQVSETKYNMAAQQKFREIFIAAYSGMMIIKNITSNKKNEKTIEPNKLIQNSIDYFQSLGINIDKKRLNSVSYNVKRKMFCEAITQIILPFIFDCRDPDENAESEFQQVLSSLESYFGNFELGYIVHNHATANDVEAIFDDLYNKDSKDLYAVPIDRSCVKRDIIKTCPTAAVKIKVNLNIDSKRSVLESIINKLQKYPFANDEQFIDPFALKTEYSLDNTPNYKEDSYFPLSDKYIPTQLFVPRFFYYVIPVNESMICMYERTYLNGDEKNLDFDSFITITEKRAVEKFRSTHREDISEYYYHIMEYIKDMFCRMTTVDYGNAIRKDGSDVEACQRFTKHFNIDYEKIIRYIEEDDCVLKCYDLIERALYSFVLSFENAIPNITKELCRFLPYAIQSHYDTIGEYLKSEQLSEAIIMRNGFLEEKSNQEEICFTNKMELWKKLSEADYIKDNIYKRIFDVLNKYHDILGAEIESNKS